MATSKTQSTLSLPDAHNPTPPAGSHPVIGLRLADGSGTEFPLDASTLYWLIGSGPGCDVQLSGDPYVSGTHAAVVRQNGTLLLADRESKNGVFLAGARVDKAFLHDGAIVLVGQTPLVAFSERSRALLTPCERLAGSTPGFAAARDGALKAARTRVNLAVLGEPATGRRTLAAAVHQASAEATLPFVTIEAAHAIEAALTDAIQEAGGGTLVVAGADALPEPAESVLGAALRAREMEPDSPRIILTGAAAMGSEPRWQFVREQALVVTLPPLRERALDVVSLIGVCTRDLCYGREVAWPTVERAALAGLDWPGNVAELAALVRQAVAASAEDIELASVWPSRDAMLAALAVAIERALALAPSRGAAGEALGLARATFTRYASRFAL